jgi:hypothetical protein
MSESPVLAAFVAGVCSGRFSSAACGGPFGREFRPKQPALWFSGSFLCERSSLWPDSISSRAGRLAAIAGLPRGISRRAPPCDAVHALKR